MHLNLARVDYLTLTKWHRGEDFLSALADLYPKQYAKEVKLGGYQGHQWEGLFVGTGRQRNKAHFIMRASGEGSDTVFWRTRDIKAKCTRLDLQVTVWLPPNWDSRKLYDLMTSPDIDWPGRKLVPVIVQNGDGLDTIYVGSRTSDRFARIYVKPDTKGNPAYLRFEMEFKNAVAQEARTAIIEKYGSAKTILRSELNRLPYSHSRSLRAFERVLGDKTYKVKPEIAYGQNSTIDWLQTQVEPAVIRLLNSHEDGDRMHDILIRWLGNYPGKD